MDLAIGGLDENLRLGIPEVDAQHAFLIERLRAFDPGKSEDEIRSLLMQLMRYTREHFLAEESFMSSIGYPRLHEHRELHDELLKRLVRFAMRDLGHEIARRDFHKFLGDWLVEHILSADAAIAAYCRTLPN